MYSPNLANISQKGEYNLNSEQLKYLLALYKEKSLNAASLKCNISYPGMSRAIKTLEKELDISLITRSNKGVEFTPAGKQLVELAEYFFDSLQTIISTNSSSIESPINFITTEALFETYLFSFWTDIKKSSLNVSCKTIDDFSLTIKHLIEDSSSLAFCFVPENTPSLYTDFIFHPIFSSNVYCVCSKKHPLANNPQITYEILNNFTCVKRAENGPSFENTIYTKSATILEKYIEHGLGFSLAHRFPIFPYSYPYIKNSVLIPVIDLPANNLCIFYHKDLKMNSSIEALFNSICKYMNIYNND